jgi:hypothetical protein
MDVVASNLPLCLGSAIASDASGRRVAGSRIHGPSVERHCDDQMPMQRRCAIQLGQYQRLFSLAGYHESSHGRILPRWFS